MDLVRIRIGDEAIMRLTEHDSKMDLVRIRIDVGNMHVTSQSRRF